jgi:hypothetical protein
MYEYKCVFDIIVLESRFLNSNYKQHLIDTLQENIRNKYKTCTKINGFITTFTDLEIIKTKIELEMNKFYVKYTARVLQPTVGNIYNSLSAIIISDDRSYGALLNIENCFKILIKDEGHVKNKKYYFNQCSCVLTEHEPFQNIMIEHIEYKNNTCYVTGKHVHEIEK